ncbi:MAG: ParA family protein [Acidobacterium ailaaui]|nr:ParA family protein [Pseudacidobacterium ailaaui]
MGYVITIAAHKGGVGKTTVATNLAAVLSERTRTVLWDCDFQANATMSYGIDPDTTEGRSVYDVLHGDVTPSQVMISLTRQLALVPSNDDLAAFDLEFHEATVLRSIVSRQEGIQILDTPPSLSLLGVNTMVAADLVLVIAQLRRFGVRGTIKYVQRLREINPRARILILPTFAHRAKVSSSTALQEIRRWAQGEGIPVSPYVIPERMALENAQAFSGRPHVWVRRDDLTLNFQQLAEEVGWNE